MNTVKYPLIYLASVILLSLAIVLFKYFAIYELTWTFPDWLKLPVLLPILVTLVSTNLPEFISEKVRLRLKWLHTRPGINQFYAFIGFQVIFLAGITLAKSVTGYNFYLNAVDVSASIVSMTVLFLYSYYMLRILNNN